MSDDNTANKNYYKRIAAEYAELDDPIIKGQMALDRWWQERRDFEEELNDTYIVGGFHSPRSSSSASLLSW